MADTSGCCGGPKGRHLDGCDGKVGGGGSRSRRRLDKAITGRRDADDAYKKAKADADAKARKKMVGRRFKTEPMQAQVPPGCRTMKLPGGGYTIVEGER